MYFTDTHIQVVVCRSRDAAPQWYLSKTDKDLGSLSHTENKRHTFMV